MSKPHPYDKYIDPLPVWKRAYAVIQSNVWLRGFAELIAVVSVFALLHVCAAVVFIGFGDMQY